MDPSCVLFVGSDDGIENQAYQGHQGQTKENRLDHALVAPVLAGLALLNEACGFVQPAGDARMNVSIAPHFQSGGCYGPAVPLNVKKEIVIRQVVVREV